MGVSGRYRYSEHFGKAMGLEEALKIRKYSTRDLVKRLGVLGRDRVVVHDYPLRHPVAVFNPSLSLEVMDGARFLKLYARIILGYYAYVSSIIEIRVPFEDVLEGEFNTNVYTGEIVVQPSTRCDLWGAEDPRVYTLDRIPHMTYTGRTINYFDPHRRLERTLPVTAVREGRRWRKAYVHVLPGELRGHLVSDKNAFLYRSQDGTLYLFHRPHMDDETFYLVVSRAELAPGTHVGICGDSPSLSVMESRDTVEVLRPAGFEVKLGWAAPPIPLGNGRILALIHAVDRELEAYRVLAAELELARDGVVVRAVTPEYIMEPRRIYEIYGDRPYVVFPCGVAEIGEGEYIISYGASDTFAALGLIRLDDLLSELDRGRIY